MRPWHWPLAAFACFLVVACSRVLAWGGEGHQVVALIAEARLTDTARAKVQELLGPDASISDAEVVNWADEIKRQRRRTAPWHYVNIPVEAKAYDRARDGNDGNNVVERLEAFEKMLADPSQPHEARVEALKFVVHLAGDVHQPLHCAERNGDRGGNTCLVWMPASKGKASNLHTVWDTSLLRTFIGKTRIADYSDGLAKRMTDEQLKAWSMGGVESWANESHNVAAAHAYAHVPDGEATRLTERYVSDSQPIVEQQLQRGGVRLAVILNRAFAPTPTTQPDRLRDP